MLIPKRIKYVIRFHIMLVNDITIRAQSTFQLQQGDDSLDAIFVYLDHSYIDFNATVVFGDVEFIHQELVLIRLICMRIDLTSWSIFHKISTILKSLSCLCSWREKKFFWRINLTIFQHRTTPHSLMSEDATSSKLPKKINAFKDKFSAFLTI